MSSYSDLTRPQQRVMEYLEGGHRARREYSSVVYVNGGKLCTVATMKALERRLLVRRDGDEWVYNGPRRNRVKVRE